MNFTLYIKNTHAGINIIDLNHTFIKLLKNNLKIIRILNSLCCVDEELWLGGGIVRSFIWDYLHKKEWTILSNQDLDIVYFDKKNVDKIFEKRIEYKLRMIEPNMLWSAKNQARMHVKNKEEPYKDIVDAISKWPETSSAIAIKIDNNNQIQTIAPYGLEDLFLLKVIATPSFESRKYRIIERMKEKKWLERWPHIHINI